MKYAFLFVLLCMMPAVAQDMQSEVDCKNPPSETDLASIYPCIEKRRTTIYLRTGKKRKGELRFANKQICDLNGPCEMKIKSGFRSFPVNADEIVSVAYRPPMSGRRQAAGWLAGGATTGLIMKALYDQDPEGGAGLLGTPQAVLLGAGVGLLATSINRDAPRTIRIVKSTGLVP